MMSKFITFLACHLFTNAHQAAQHSTPHQAATGTSIGCELLHQTSGELWHGVKVLEGQASTHLDSQKVPPMAASTADQSDTGTSRPPAMTSSTCNHQQRQQHHRHHQQQQRKYKGTTAAPASTLASTL
jgi:hypothetical protein